MANDLKAVEIPIDDTVITRQHIMKEEEREGRIDAYIIRLEDDYEVGLSFENNLEAHFKKNKTHERVQEMTWEDAIPLVARRMKDTSDATFATTDDNGVTVNRTNGIAFIGGAANNDEDCYIGIKLARALGLVYIEHQARI